MSRVLVVDSLQPFLEATPVPPNISATTFPEAVGIPEGQAVGLMPTVTTRVTAADMDRLHGLRVIANYGVGYDNIDTAAARERGIVVSNTPGVLTDATAELTWALILAAARRLGEGERLVRAGAWDGWKPTQLRGMGLKGKRLGIVGAGRIGREVGSRAKAFGMRLAYWSRTRQRDWELDCNALFLDLDELLATSDVVTIHVAKAEETERLVDARKLKDGAILINTARGAVVEEAGLIAELQSGRIRAGLDVYAAEPNVSPALRSLENVVLLPHLGSATQEARQAMWDLAWENVLHGLRGEPLLTPVA